MRGLSRKKNQLYMGLRYIVSTYFGAGSIKFIILASQPVLLHGLIRINIKISLIADNYNYLSHTLFYLLNILTHALKIHIYHYLVAIDFILHHTSICVRYIFNWTIHLRIGIFIIHEYMVTHIMVVFLYKQEYK